MTIDDLDVEKEPQDEVAQDSGGVDTEAALAEISSDLFGQGKEEDTSEVSSSEGSGEAPPVTGVEEAPSTQGSDEGTKADETSKEVQELGAPSTWTKEALQEWATIGPRAKAEIHKREQDALRGIGEYKEAAETGKAFTSVYEPYKDAMESAGVNPVELFQNFAGNHYLLSTGTPEQKLSIATNLMTHYGINPKDLIDRMQGQTAPNPELAALHAEINQLKAGQQQITKRESEATRAHYSSQVDAFANDPANIYFEEVAQDMSALLKSGVAVDLADAYEKAVFANPVTRQKELDRLTSAKVSERDAAEQARKNTVAKRTSSNVATKASSGNGTVPVGSLEETIQETYAAIMARG